MTSYFLAWITEWMIIPITGKNWGGTSEKTRYEILRNQLQSKSKIM